MPSKCPHDCFRSLLRLILACIWIITGGCDSLQYEGIVMMPPSIPGAEYVGPETCSTPDCHQTEQRYFHLTKHAAAAVRITDEDAEEGVAEGCETCHGPGSLHVENRGRKPGDILRGNPDACFSCHLNIKSSFMLQHHHPVPEGRMSCPDCHDMHGNNVKSSGGAMLNRYEDKCFKCHKDKRGPFVFEHDAMRDGCRSCHNPHGSINDKLLVAGQTITCIRCHWESRFNTATANIGTHQHNSHAVAAGQNCIDCHPAVHGSNIWRSFKK